MDKIDKILCFMGTIVGIIGLTMQLILCVRGDGTTTLDVILTIAWVITIALCAYGYITDREYYQD